MEKKQLDFNAPLLSVRRLSTPTANITRVSSSSSSSSSALSNTNKKSKPTRQQSLPTTRSIWDSDQEPTKPASIPFIWEQTPGQAKDRNNHPDSNRFHSTTPSIDDQSSEDLHSDAFESLSVSFSCNYSESNSETESSKSFDCNLQTREYLINRFLPAAKSVIIETPQYVSKKQEASIPEPPKYVKKVYSGELRPLLLEKYPINAHNRQTDGESLMVDDSKKKSGKKGWGFGFFLPRICTKRASCLSNPMRTKVHQIRSPVADAPGPGSGPDWVPRLSRRTSYSGPLTPSLEKQAMDAVIKRTIESQSKEANETRRVSNPLTRSGNSLPSSPQRGSSRSGQISPYRNESPRSPFHDGARFLGVPKDVQNRSVQPKTCPSLNVKSHFSPRLIYDSPPVAPEKTALYIDWNEKSTNPTKNEVKIEPNGDVDDSVRVPPLPKSPSESWLRRKMSLRSASPKKRQEVTIEKGPKNEPKWEIIVKTSNVHHDHARYSEELLNVSKYKEISF